MIREIYLNVHKKKRLHDGTELMYSNILPLSNSLAEPRLLIARGNHNTRGSVGYYSLVWPFYLSFFIFYYGVIACQAV